MGSPDHPIIGALSPESLVIPPEDDLNTKQERISGERFPDNILILCDKCNWSCTCFNLKGLIEICPTCSNKVLSRIPLPLDEECLVEYDDNRGITLTFSRKQPLR
jgi:hypothetical protein